MTGVWLIRYFPAQYTGEIMHTLIFFFAFNFITTVVNLPISYYSTFVLEEKFGFNKQTLKLWVTDMLKGQALMAAFGIPLLSGFLAIIQKTGNQFFFYLWLFSVGVQVAGITIYPILILPLFNKLAPLEEGPLKTSVEALARRLQFPLKELYVIDGSKRSAHSNAYFYGLPWKKHIVIYDTLIEKSETEEVVAVLSHELGHWSLGHTTKLFGIAQVWIPRNDDLRLLRSLVVPHVLYLHPLLRVHQQSLPLPVLWLSQGIPYHYRLHPFLRCFSTDGYCCEAVDEHLEQDIRIPSRCV